MPMSGMDWINLHRHDLPLRLIGLFRPGRRDPQGWCERSKNSRCLGQGGPQGIHGRVKK